jgi:hypothetical protein
MKANMLALTCGVCIALLCAELLLRVSPPDFMADNLWAQYDQDVGWKKLPTANGKVTNGCISLNHIHVNSLGFRDKEWSDETRYQIAVLGDSYMEGQHLPEGTIAPQVLEQLLGVPVLNAGLDGMGTLHEYLVYKKYIAKYKPKIVLLFMYPFNDIQDNSQRLAAKYRLVSPRASLDASGTMTTHFPDAPPLTDSSFRLAVKQYSKTALMFFRGYEYWTMLSLSIPNVYFSRVYLPEDESWREAWTIAEQVLSALNHEVQANGGTLFLVPIPEYIQLSRDWKQDLTHFYGAELPEGFSRERPLRGIERIARLHDIPLIPLEQAFRDYRDRFDVHAPYFYYRCDGHWNPLGHFVAANVVAQYLVARGAITGMPATFERNLQTSPRQILGEGYVQIYGRSLYRNH